MKNFLKIFIFSILIIVVFTNSAISEEELLSFSNEETLIEFVEDAAGWRPQATANILGDKCYFNDVEFSCRIYAGGVEHGMKITGGDNKDFPQEFMSEDEKVIIPYLYITEVNYEISRAYPPKVTYYFKIIKDTQEHKFILVDNYTISKDSRFITITRSMHEYYKNSIITFKNVIEKSLLGYELSQPGEYSALSNDELNKKLMEVNYAIANKNAENDNLTKANRDKSERIGELKNQLENLRTKLSACRAEAEGIEKMILYYKENGEELDKLKKYELMNLGEVYLCRFQLVTEELIKLIPGSTIDMNEMRNEVMVNKKIDKANEFFQSSYFYVNME